jgi:hypothetical protein
MVACPLEGSSASAAVASVSEICPWDFADCMRAVKRDAFKAMSCPWNWVLSIMVAQVRPTQDTGMAILTGVIEKGKGKQC